MATTTTAAAATAPTAPSATRPGPQRRRKLRRLALVAICLFVCWSSSSSSSSPPPFALGFAVPPLAGRSPPPTPSCSRCHRRTRRSQQKHRGRNSSSRLFLLLPPPPPDAGTMTTSLEEAVAAASAAFAVKSAQLHQLLVESLPASSSSESAAAAAANPVDHYVRAVAAALKDSDAATALLGALGDLPESWHQRYGLAVAAPLSLGAAAAALAVTFGLLLALSPTDAEDGGRYSGRSGGGAQEEEEAPYRRGMYDPIRARAYYERRPQLVARRVLELLRLSQGFLLRLLADRYVFGREEANRPKRAGELLELITRLGPAAIKIGQALSVRSDLIPAEYADALSSLQDQVPPFGCDDARRILIRELGKARYGSLAGLGLDGFGRSGPVASASIGQVYRCFIGDREVAVKVQRPNVLSEIALDLHITREFAPLYRALIGANTDLQALADEWARGFIKELDYRLEAEATTRFTEEMKARNLNAVCAPTVIEDGYSTEQVLVTEWIDGTRIDQSDASDIPRLCSVALNAYLVMLLEMKSLHCDPHPGNLLRTKDGKLCILDFGMTLDIDPSLQYSLLEYVAHLTSDNYDELPEDMVKIGFMKKEKLEFAKRSGVLEPLKYFLKKIGQGGGGTAVRERIYAEYREKNPGMSDEELRQVMRSEMKQQMAEVVRKEGVATGITVEVEELQRQNRDSFQIPEWFLYTSRAFLTLEGVSLQADPDYSIIRGCFPYIAKRLVGDDDPRARKALRDLLYGAGNALDVKRLSDLADGFTTYTTTTKTINKQAAAKGGEVILTSGQVEKVSKEEERKQKMVEAEAAITLAKDSADILLAPEGNLVQTLLIEEGALAASARFKDAMKRTFVDAPKSFRDKLPFGAFLPPLPFEHQVAPFVRKSPEELKAQELAEKLVQIAPKSASLSPSSPPMSASGSGDSKALPAFVARLRQLDPEQAALVLKELRENLPKYGPMMGKLGGSFVSSLLKTASSNIETTLSELERAGKEPDGVTRVTAKRLSSAAQRGATVFTSATSSPPNARKSGRRDR